MSAQKMLDGYDVIRTRGDLEQHMTLHTEAPGWVLLSPTLLPGVYLVEHGRLIQEGIGELCRAEEVMLEALGAGDAENLVRGLFLVAPLLSGLYTKTLADVAEATERRVRAEEARARAGRVDGTIDRLGRVKVAVREVVRRGGGCKPYAIDLDDVDAAPTPAGNAGPDRNVSIGGSPKESPDETLEAPEESLIETLEAPEEPESGDGSDDSGGGGEKGS